MTKTNDQLHRKLVNDDEFDDANLSDTSDEADVERVELHKLKVTKGIHGVTGKTERICVLPVTSCSCVCSSAHSAPLLKNKDCCNILRCIRCPFTSTQHAFYPSM